MVGKKKKTIIILILLCISFMYGCIGEGENKEKEVNFFNWKYGFFINNPNNTSFFLYLPLPMFSNGTYINIKNHKNVWVKNGDISIIKTIHGYVLNISSNGTVSLGTGETNIGDNNDIIDHLTLTTINVSTANTWIYSNISNTNLYLRFIFGYSSKKMIGEKVIENQYHMSPLNSDISIKNGWQMVNCYLWGQQHIIESQL